MIPATKPLVMYILDNYMPWTDCTNTEFQGFEYELLNYGYTQLKEKHLEVFDFTFQCLPSDSLSVAQLFQDYILNNGTVGMVGGVTINSQRISSGYLFSIPTYQDNLVALSYSGSTNEFILQSFIDISTSLTFFFSLIFVGLLFLVYEKNVNVSYAQNLPSAVFQGLWHAYMIMYRITHKIYSFPSKCLHISTVCTSLFLVILLISSIIISYTKPDFTQLRAPSQLAGKNVYSISIYYDVLMSYGINIDQFWFSDDSSIGDVVQGLADNKINYIIMDASVLTNVAQNKCGYQISSIDFFQFNMGVVFAKTDKSSDFLRITNKAIALAKSNTTLLYNLVQKYYNPNSNCNAARKAFFENDEAISDPIDYRTFLALFIVILIILVISAVAKLFERKMHVFLKNKEAVSKMIKKSTDVDSQILKKISIFFEILTEKWMLLLKNFEEEQASFMEKEKNCKFFVHEIYNRVYYLINNPNNNNSSENNILLETKTKQSIPKSTLLSASLQRRNKYSALNRSSFVIFEDFALDSEETEAKNEKLRIKRD